MGKTIFGLAIKIHKGDLGARNALDELFLNLVYPQDQEVSNLSLNRTWVPIKHLCIRRFYLLSFSFFWSKEFTYFCHCPSNGLITLNWRVKKGGKQKTKLIPKQRRHVLTEAKTNMKREYPHIHQNRTRLAFEPR